MTDITMCNNKECSKKETCYRFTAKPDKWLQSYFLEQKEEGCEYFLKQ